VKARWHCRLGLANLQAAMAAHPALPRALAVLLAASPLSPLGGQLPPLTVPRGYLRVEASGGFAVHDQRFRNGTVESAAADFARDPAGRSLFPGLRIADSLLARVTGLSDAALHLGRTSATQLVFIGTGGMGLAWGLTSRVTLFGYVPVVRVRVRSTFALDSLGSVAGINPANPLFGDGPGRSAAAVFFQQFDASLGTLAQRLQNGAYDHDPSLRALAQETLARGTALRQDLFALMLGGGVGSLFLPTQSSTPGLRMQEVVAAFQARLSGELGVTGFTQIPPLPQRRASNADLTSVLQHPQGPFRGSLETPTVAALGDVELGLAIGLVDTYDAETRRGFRLAAQALARLRTSRRPTPGRFFDVGTGDRQPDVELGFVADVLLDHVGTRLTGGYNLQLPGEAQARIAAPSEPFPTWDRLAAVRYDLGDVLTLGASPYLRLARNFAFTTGATWHRRRSDAVTLVTGQAEIPGAPPGLLAEDSERTWITATAGFLYSAGAIGGQPLDAGAWWEGVVAATGGRVPRSSTIRFLLRVYHRF
jgi:hypothetical protein